MKPQNVDVVPYIHAGATVVFYEVTLQDYKPTPTPLKITVLVPVCLGCKKLNKKRQRHALDKVDHVKRTVLLCAPQHAVAVARHRLPGPRTHAVLVRWGFPRQLQDFRRGTVCELFGHNKVLFRSLLCEGFCVLI